MEEIPLSLPLFGTIVDIELDGKDDKFLEWDILPEKNKLVPDFKICSLFFIFGKVFLGLFQYFDPENMAIAILNNRNLRRISKTEVTPESPIFIFFFVEIRRK